MVLFAPSVRNFLSFIMALFEMAQGGPSRARISPRVCQRPISRFEGDGDGGCRIPPRATPEHHTSATVHHIKFRMYPPSGANKISQT